MIDTIKLVFDSTQFKILDQSKFTKNTMNAGRGYYSMVQNPSKSEVLNGDYKPRLTLTTRYNCSGRSGLTLSVELSLPKLIFGNNFDELSETDFEQLVKSLDQKLQEMSVRIFWSSLVNAPVSAIHYSKNIVLTDGSTPYHFINKFRQCDLSGWLDVNEADYRNGGHSFKIHTNSYEVIFYDKIKDLEASKKGDKRAIEDENLIQLGLFEQIQEKNKFEVLRFEVRLNSRQKLNQILRQTHSSVPMTFKELFNKGISQKVLLFYLNELELARPRILDLEATNKKDFFLTLINKRSTRGLKQAIFLFGLRNTLEVFAPRELKQFAGNNEKKNWYRLLREANNLVGTTKSPFQDLRRNLNEFAPLRLVDFEYGLINNGKVFSGQFLPSKLQRSIS